MRLKDWRIKAGRTIASVAEELGVQSSTVVRWENGERDPDAVGKRKIFLMSGGAVSPDDFYDVPAWRRMLAGLVDRIAGRAA